MAWGLVAPKVLKTEGLEGQGRRLRGPSGGSRVCSTSASEHRYENHCSGELVETSDPFSVTTNFCRVCRSSLNVSSMNKIKTISEE